VRTLAVVGTLAILSHPGLASNPPPPEPALPPGAYRLEMWQSHLAKFPVLGKTRTTWVSVALARLREGEGGRLEQEHEVCDVRFESGLPLMSMAMPDPMRESLGHLAYPVRLERDAEGLRYRADFGFEHVGYRPKKPDAKPPKKSDDPAVFDSDHDGKPGATLHLEVPIIDPLELYIVQRGHSVLDGRVLEDGRVEGAMVSDLVQNVIGSDPYFLKRSPKLEPDPEHSRFVLTPVPEGTTCESLLPAEEDDAQAAAES